MSAQMQPVTVRLPADLANRLKSLAERGHIDEAILMRRAIEEKVSQWEKDGKIEITLRDVTPAQAAALTAAGEKPKPVEAEVSYHHGRRKGSASNQPKILGSFGEALDDAGAGGKGHGGEGGSSRHR